MTELWKEFLLGLLFLLAAIGWVFLPGAVRGLGSALSRRRKWDKLSASEKLLRADERPKLSDKDHRRRDLISILLVAMMALVWLLTRT